MAKKKKNVEATLINSEQVFTHKDVKYDIKNSEQIFAQEDVKCGVKKQSFGEESKNFLGIYK